FSVNARFNKDVLGEKPGFSFLGLAGIDAEMSEKLNVPGFILKGIGNQVGLHVYDATPTFDFNLPGFLGETLGSFSGRPMISTFLPVYFLLASLNAPLYVAVPV